MNRRNKSPSLFLAFLTLGIVFGDIGTSPLYALRETFFGHHPLVTSPQNIIGALSLFFWSLTVVVSLKYVFLIMRANNEGEGGIFSLLGLIRQCKDDIPPRIYSAIGILILFGAALLYGDGMITPAISVLSAVEGLKVGMPRLGGLVIPLTIIILFVLFFFQKRGTHSVANSFSPIMVIWFGAMVIFAVPEIIKYPEVLASLNPMNGIKFLLGHGFYSFWILGSVVLCVTGAEALYADMGHFGRPAIAKAWLFVVYPCLVINYFGQGARLLDSTPIASNNLFYGLVPVWAFWPMIFIATMATVIASQALISGSYSITQQAIALGVFPRLKILHTNPDIKGQIYIPFINWSLFIGCTLLVMLFRDSGNLAAAYGVAVTGTMAITTCAFFVVAYYKWHWPLYVIGSICGLLVAIDLAFFVANVAKIFQGGFVPLLIGGFLLGVMWIWQWGHMLVRAAFEAYGRPRKISWMIGLRKKLQEAGGVLKDSNRPRLMVESDRAVVFLVSRPISDESDSMPAIVRVYLKHSGVFPRHVIMLTIIQDKVSYVNDTERYKVISFGYNIWSLQARFGFMENPDGRVILRKLREMKIVGNELHRCAIEIGEEDLLPNGGMRYKTKMLIIFFEWILKVSVPAHHYFGLRDVTGISKTVISVRVGGGGARVEIPEFAFDPVDEANSIDPDTLEPSETEFIKTD